MKDESISTSPAGIRMLMLPSLPTAISHSTSEPRPNVIITVSLSIDEPLSAEPAWCSTKSISVHVVVKSIHPPRDISRSRVAPSEILASSKPTATPPPFSPAFASVTTTTHLPGAITADQLSWSLSNTGVMD